MPQLTFLPHADYCPDGLVVTATAGDTLLDVALDNGIDMPHECEKSCACTTCHMIVRTGFSSIEEADELEEDVLGKAWALEEASRLSCQAVVGKSDLVVEIPKYTINTPSK